MTWLHHFSEKMSAVAKAFDWAALTTRDVCSLAIVATFFTLLGVEAWSDRSTLRSAAVRRSYRTNLATFFFNDLVMSLLSATSVLALAAHVGGAGLFGDDLSPWLKGAIAFLLLDLLLYGQHWASHRFDLLWRIHKVHHSDRSVNVSTAFRLSVLEVLLTTLTKAGVVLLTGVDLLAMAAIETVFAIAVMFHHANIRFAGEATLGRFIVTPTLHRTHHSVLRSEHDSNYGYVLSFWDRAFRTLRLQPPVAIGLPFVPTQSFWQLLLFGFVKHYEPSPSEVKRMVAEAAYYRAEKRGFQPGREEQDWLDAEHEMRAS